MIVYLVYVILGIVSGCIVEAIEPGSFWIVFLTVLIGSILLEVGERKKEIQELKNQIFDLMKELKGKRNRMEKCYNRECTFNRADDRICECPCAGFCGGFVSKMEIFALRASNKAEEADHGQE